MSIELKIKSKHLTKEARIIRFEERKLLKQVAANRAYHYATGANGEYNTLADSKYNKYNSLRNHRTQDVRNENRATFLARAYIAGVPYKQVERLRKPEKEFDFWNSVYPRIITMAFKYGPTKDGDWEWDKDKKRNVPTKLFKTRIKDWLES